MSAPRLVLTILIPLTLLILALMACGPTSPLENIPQASPGEATPTPTADIPTSVPTKEMPKPKLPRSTKPPLNTAQAAPTPFPEHPSGVAGCEELTIFSPLEDLQYRSWCSDQITSHVRSACSGRQTTAEQISCGREALANVKSFIYRNGVYQCLGVMDGSSKRECINQSTDDLDKAAIKMFKAWNKVQIGADGDPEVASAMKDVTTCLEELGFENVDLDLLFNWQMFVSPASGKDWEERLTQAQKTLRAEATEPSKSCAKQNGLYEAQDAAWIAELERLHREEPETVKILIDEGLLVALKKPGPEVFLTGDRPS